MRTKRLLSGLLSTLIVLTSLYVPSFAVDLVSDEVIKSDPIYIVKQNGNPTEEINRTQEFTLVGENLTLTVVDDLGTRKINPGDRLKFIIDTNIKLESPFTISNIIDQNTNKSVGSATIQSTGSGLEFTLDIAGDLDPIIVELLVDFEVNGLKVEDTVSDGPITMLGKSYTITSPIITPPSKPARIEAYNGNNVKGVWDTFNNKSKVLGEVEFVIKSIGEATEVFIYDERGSIPLFVDQVKINSNPVDNLVPANINGKQGYKFQIPDELKNLPEDSDIFVSYWAELDYDYIFSRTERGEDTEGPNESNPVSFFHQEFSAALVKNDTILSKDDFVKYDLKFDIMTTIGTSSSELVLSGSDVETRPSGSKATWLIKLNMSEFFFSDDKRFNMQNAKVNFELEPGVTVSRVYIDEEVKTVIPPGGFDLGTLKNYKEIYLELSGKTGITKVKTLLSFDYAGKRRTVTSADVAQVGFERGEIRVLSSQLRKENDGIYTDWVVEAETGPGGESSVFLPTLMIPRHYYGNYVITGLPNGTYGAQFNDLENDLLKFTRSIKDNSKNTNMKYETGSLRAEVDGVANTNIQEVVYPLVVSTSTSKVPIQLIEFTKLPEEKTIKLYFSTKFITHGNAIPNYFLSDRNSEHYTFHLDVALASPNKRIVKTGSGSVVNNLQIARRDIINPKDWDSKTIEELTTSLTKDSIASYNGRGGYNHKTNELLYYISINPYKINLEDLELNDGFPGGNFNSSKDGELKFILHRTIGDTLSEFSNGEKLLLFKGEPLASSEVDEQAIVQIVDKIDNINDFINYTEKDLPQYKISESTFTLSNIKDSYVLLFKIKTSPENIKKLTSERAEFGKYNYSSYSDNYFIYNKTMIHFKKADDYSFISNQASPEVKFKNLQKTAVKSTNGTIDWKIDFLPNGVTYEKLSGGPAILVDTLSTGMEPIFRPDGVPDVTLIKMTPTTNNDYPTDEGLLIHDTLTADQLKWNPATRQLSIEVPNDGMPYRIKYKTDILSKASILKNSVEFSSDTVGVYPKFKSVSSVTAEDADVTASTKRSSEFQVIKKDDTNGAVLPNAKLGLFIANKKVREITTDSLGLGRFSHLRPGEYLIKEIEAPTGYQLRADGVKVIVKSQADGSTKIFDEFDRELTEAVVFTNAPIGKPQPKDPIIPRPSSPLVPIGPSTPVPPTTTPPSTGGSGIPSKTTESTPPISPIRPDKKEGPKKVEIPLIPLEPAKPVEPAKSAPSGGGYRKIGEKINEYNGSPLEGLENTSDKGNPDNKLKISNVPKTGIGHQNKTAQIVFLGAVLSLFAIVYSKRKLR